MKQRERRARFGAWLFAWSLFGYPIVANVAAMLQVDNQQAAVPFRLVIGIVSALALLARGRMVLDAPRIIIVVCWMAYAGRLTYDAISETAGADYALQLFVIGSVLPALAQLKLGRFEPKLYARATFIVTSAGCMSMLVGRYVGLIEVVDLFEITGRLATKTVNAVTLGHLAVSGLLSGVVLWSNSRGVRRWLLAPVMAVLFTTLVLSGSKGPSMILGLLLIVRAGRGVVSSGSFFVVLFASLASLWFDQIPLLDRLENISDDPSTSKRIDVLHDSLLQIIDYPWIGSCFVEMKSGLYAHTILLDVPMAIGLPLASLLLTVILLAARWALKFLSGPESFFGLLCLQSVLGAMFSGALYGAALMWTTLIIVLVLGAARNAALLRKRSGADVEFGSGSRRSPASLST